MNEKDFFKEATKAMIVDLKGMDMNNVHKEMKVKSRKRLHISVYSKAAVIIIVCVISLGTVGVGASALYHRWSDGIRDKYQISSGDTEKYEQSGLASFPGEDSDVNAVTQDGVTISVAQTIVDNYFAYVALKVEGFAIEDGQTPGFGIHTCTLNGKAIGSFSSFYAEKVLDETGKVATRDGELIQNYELEDGSMEYHILLDSEGTKGFLGGKKISIELGNLGVYDDSLGIQTENEGTWKFEWTLSGDSTSVIRKVHTVLENTGAVVTECEISPISIRAVIDISNAKHIKNDELYAVLSGVKLKDGTILTHITDSGTGSLLKNGTYQILFSTDRILDVDQVESLLFQKTSKCEGSTYTIEDLYEVPFR